MTSLAQFSAGIALASSAVASHGPDQLRALQCIVIGMKRRAAAKASLEKPGHRAAELGHGSASTNSAQAEQGEGLQRPGNATPTAEQGVSRTSGRHDTALLRRHDTQHTREKETA